MTQPETEESKPYANPYCDREEFATAIYNSAEYQAMLDYAISVLYSNLRNQGVINRPKGQLLTASIGIRNPADASVRPFHFALITENGHVANQPE